MQSLMKRLYINAALRFILSFLFTIFALIPQFYSYRRGGGIFSAIMGAALSVFFLIKLFQAMLYGKAEIDSYLERTEYTEYELEDEYRHAIKMGRVKMGMVHIFYLTYGAAHIVPVSEIYRLCLKRYRRRRSFGYFYILELSHMGSLKPAKFRFSNASVAHNLINTLISRNPNIEYIPFTQFDQFGFSSFN